MSTSSLAGRIGLADEFMRSLTEIRRGWNGGRRCGGTRRSATDIAHYANMCREMGRFRSRTAAQFAEGTHFYLAICSHRPPEIPLLRSMASVIEAALAARSNHSRPSTTPATTEPHGKQPRGHGTQSKLATRAGRQGGHVERIDIGGGESNRCARAGASRRNSSSSAFLRELFLIGSPHRKKIN